MAVCFHAGRAFLDVVLVGPVARLMAEHIFLMNVMAPVAAVATTYRRPASFTRLASGRQLLAAVAVQLGLLWAWHFPAALALANERPALHAPMQLSLLAAAIWFWLAVLASGGTARWRALVALLVTSKLFCLLGVLLVFSPRLLYPMLTLGHHAGAPGSISGDLLADQHFAGLLMLVACPLTYLAAGVAIAAQWLRELSADGIDSPTLRPISLPA